MAIEEIVMGLVGLHERDWCEDFYPDDIPDDWRFAFITNEIRALYLSQRDLSALAEDPEDWNDEIDEGFIFLYTPIPALEAVASALADDGAELIPVADDDQIWTPAKRVKGVPIGILDLNKDPQPAELRLWVDQFVEDAGDQRRLVLLFDGKGAAYGVRDARVLVELMGY